MNKNITSTTTAVALLLCAGPLAAHPVHDELATFTSGILHPLMNWVHLLSVTAIGLWLHQRYRKLDMKDILGCAAIGSLLILNTYLHGLAISALTWDYLAGFSVGTLMLLVAGALASVFLRLVTTPTTSKIDSQHNHS